VKIRWSLRALAQLEAAHAYIARDNEPSARDFVAAVDSLTSLLAQFPGLGVQTSRPQVRMFPLLRYRYLVYYRSVGDDVQILRIVHTARKRR
jgi:plasmid stabilization system protein ParE